MSKISEPEIKKLWGRSAGLCAFPGCGTDCLPVLSGNVAVIGEMAHIIAREPDGTRGEPEGGPNDYDNLILLCPTCHTLVDKEPFSFPAQPIGYAVGKG
jgi:5-methylcytosine-specific restriction endonuclease McrA